QGGRPVSGTSFAAPLVAATVAQVRSRHLQLSAREGMARIERTAYSHAEGWNPRVGHGVDDPLAAVTAPLPAERQKPLPVAVSAPSPPPVPDHRPRTIALISAAAVLAATVLVLVLTAPARRLARSRT